MTGQQLVTSSGQDYQVEEWQPVIEEHQEEGSEHVADFVLAPTPPVPFNDLVAVNLAIAVPREIRPELEGEPLKLLIWQPHVEVGELVKITGRCYIPGKV